jgi:hypothetical protein
MDSPLMESSNISFFPKFLSVTLTTLLLSSTEGLMGLREERPSSPLSFKGPEFSDESPTFKWEWSSDPLDCPSDEGCNPEPMVGTMSPREGTLALPGRGGS